MSHKNNIDFSDFFTSSPQEWKNAILKELKNPNEEILIKSSECLDIKGFYTKNDLKELSYLEQFHNQYKNTSPRKWNTIEYFPLDIIDEFDKALMNAQNGGADGYYFDIKNVTKSTKEILRLLRNVDKSKAWILGRTESSFYELIECLKDVDNFDITGLILIKLKFLDPHKIMDNLYEYEKASATFRTLKNLKILGIDSTELNVVASSQIAYSLSYAIDLIDLLTDSGQSIEEVLPHIGFSIAIRDNYFIEIAKLRAYRLLWSMIVKEYSAKFNSFTTPIHCMTLGKSGVDSNTNLLHHTTQAMSAIIGGCDALTIVPSDIDSKGFNDFSSRMARNISILLKEEAHLDYTTDPAGGSYMIESLTHQIAQQALEKLQLIESHKGLINYLKGGHKL